MSNTFSFPQQLYRFNLQAKKLLEPLLRVKYFQFSTATVQIQLGGKKNGWNLCCMSNIFSFPQQLYRFNLQAKKLKDRITPHVTNFFTLRLSIEKQEGKRKYKSDGAVMLGEFVCVYVCACTVSE